MSLHRNFFLFGAIALVAIVFATSGAVAQSSEYLHSAGIVLDDGAGHTTTLLPTGNYSTFTPAYFDAYLPGFFSRVVAPGAFVGSPLISPISGFTFDGTSGYIASNAGIYSVDYSVHPTNASTFGVYLNGAAVPISIIDCAANVATRGSVLVTMNAGDVLQLGNAGATSASLATPSPNASILTFKAIRVQ